MKKLISMALFTSGTLLVLMATGTSDYTAAVGADEPVYTWPIGIAGVACVIAAIMLWRAHGRRKKF